MKKLKLQSGDGEIFEVDLEVAQMSETIKTMFEDIGMDKTDETPLILPNVNAAILKKVIEWSTYHLGDSPVEDEIETDQQLRSDDISDWNAKFLTVKPGTLFELVKAANYLNITGLLQVASKTVANLIKGKSPEAILDVFNVPDPFKYNLENWPADE